MTGVSLLGPWPGERVLEAQTTVLGELTAVPEGVRGLPSAVQLPARGPWATSVARTAALLTDMPVEIGTHGWKLADRPGFDLERTSSLLREDLDALAIAGHGYQGPLVVSVRGPWTLSAILYLARGDRVLSDAGAARDVAASLADGLGGLMASLRTAVPGARPVLVVREPMLPDVLSGTLATFSGHGRLPAVPLDDAAAALREVVDAARAAGVGEVVAHGGGRFASRALQALARSGAESVGIAAGAVRGPQWEQVAALVEDGRRMWLGLPQDRWKRPAGPQQVADLITRPWTAVGLPARSLEDVVVHVETSGGLGGGDLLLSDTRDVRHAIGTSVRVAGILAERADAG
ncbi:hypothetical protein J4G33_03315 [Actinotalea sp. BY-33]|uniref:Methionine synthase n=1 Tax=Actinotalea soli TaxID=2819234 RepID=A0A939LQM7_9CELL|nr:hypothetical protein [Actinotalea soli]MBO1750825.1 hypothetical protein [Actinotalea soli]